jgi:hypothetical protein
MLGAPGHIPKLCYMLHCHGGPAAQLGPPVILRERGTQGFPFFFPGTEATHWSGSSSGGSLAASQQGHRRRGGSSREWWHLATTVGGFGSWRDGLRQLGHGGRHGHCSSAMAVARSGDDSDGGKWCGRYSAGWGR